MIFSPDVQRIHGDIAVSGSLHTDGGRGAAAYDADEGEYEEEEFSTGSLDSYHTQINEEKEKMTIMEKEIWGVP